MTLNALILNAGDGSRWGNYMGSPKQLVKIGPESTLERTVRMLRQFGVSEITSVCHDPRLAPDGLNMFHPRAHRWTAESLLASSPLWSGRILVLLGDVFFTEAALRRMIFSQQPIGVFGRSGPNRFNGRTHGEIFGLTISADAAGAVRAAATKVIALTKGGAWGNLWDVYHVLTDLPIRSAEVEHDIFVELNDLTDDFDTPRDYRSTIAIYEQYLTNPTNFEILDFSSVRNSDDQC